jgi:dCTP deaminase
MILPGHVVKEYIEQELISVRPAFDDQQLRPFGLRVHLASKLMVAKPGQKVSLRTQRSNSVKYEAHLLEGKRPFVLSPGAFALGSTIELLQLHPSLMCRLDGRSTLARLGLLVHCSSTTIDSNHREHRSVVLELANVGPFAIELGFGDAIGMVTFERVAGEAAMTYDQHQYRGQAEVTPANLSFGTPPYRGKRLKTKTRKTPKRRIR